MPCELLRAANLTLDVEREVETIFWGNNALPVTCHVICILNIDWLLLNLRDKRLEMRKETSIHSVFLISRLPLLFRLQERPGASNCTALKRRNH